MNQSRQIQGLLIALGISLVLLVGFYLLHISVSDESRSGNDEMAAESTTQDASKPSGGQPGTGGKQKGEKPQKMSMERGAGGENLLEAIVGEGESRKQMKDHLQRIRESSR